MLTDLDSRDPLSWLSRILWPDRSITIGRDDEAPARWWASPSADAPKILIPASSPKAAKTAVRRYHDGFDSKLRFRSLLAEGLMSAGPLAGMALRGNELAVVDDGAGTDDDPFGDGVIGGIRDLMGIADLTVAVSLSTPKSNQKPVLQLLDGDGRCHGWAKVGWNDRTTALVETEARWLRMAGRAARPLAMPHLLHDVELCGRRVVISSTATPTRRPRRAPDAPPPVELFSAVAGLGTPDLVRIKESPWWHRVESVLDQATPRERLAMLAAADACYRLHIRVGAWHGDLTPWNMMTGRDDIAVIDWEFAADGVPIGFDVFHFHTQVGAEVKGMNAAEAIDRSARLGPHGLAALGVEAENRTAIWRLYLVELLRRLLALRADGYPTEEIRQGPAALVRLEKSLGMSGVSTPPNPPARYATDGFAELVVGAAAATNDAQN